MNYIILKWIIDATIANFRCKDCWSQISEWNINILWSAWNSVNLEVVCPKCKTQWVIKAEIWLVNSNINPETLSNLKNSISQIQSTNITKNEDSIKDKDILDLRNNLKNCNSIKDLFN